MKRKLRVLLIVALLLLAWVWSAQSSTQNIPHMGEFGSILNFDPAPAWKSNGQAPFKEKGNRFEFNKTIGSAQRIEFPKVLNGETPIRIHTALGEVQQFSRLWWRVPGRVEGAVSNL